MKLVIAPDKFKGSLTALEAAEAIAQGFQRIYPDAEIVKVPIADGGEGTAEAIVRATGGSWVDLEARDPLQREVAGRYGWLRESTARSDCVIEMSEFSGYWRVGANEKDPLNSNTFGTGQAMRDAADRGAKRMLLGLGGSATNDGGMGMAAALGYRLLDAQDKELEPLPKNLGDLRKILPPKEPLDARILVASDVTNPLLGEHGATAVYGPQKGVTEETHPILEEGLRNLAEVVKRDLGKDLAEEPGAGAAGGLGFGLMAFADAELKPGFDLIAEIIGLEARIQDADLVITGEGSLDAQSLHGKGPVGVAKLAANHGAPTLALAGHIADTDRLAEVFAVTSGIVQNVCELQEAMDHAGQLLKERARLIAKLIKIGSDLKTP